MNRALSLLIALSLPFALPAQEGEPAPKPETAFELKIEIDGLEGSQEWFLEKPVMGEGLKVIERFQLVDGRGKVSGEVPYPTLCRLRSLSSEGLLPLFITPGETRIEAELDDMKLHGFVIFDTPEFEVEGAATALNEELIALWSRTEMLELASQSRRLNKPIEGAVMTHGGERRPALKRKMRELQQANVEAIIRYVEEQPTSYVSLFYAVTLCHVFGPEELEFETIERYFPLFEGEIRSTDEYAAIAEAHAFAERNRVGAMVEDFTLPATDGSEVSLADFRGKLLLVDAWASWCHTCAAERQTLKDLYAKYHDRGLEMLSISVDEDTEAWRKAVDEHACPWPQLIDTRGYQQSLINQRFRPMGLPFLFLVSADGELLAKNLRGKQALEQKLDELLPD